MSKRRNRHSRGHRGPVVLPRSYGGRIDRVDPTHAEFFHGLSDAGCSASTHVVPGDP
ncbi:hypothetical protein JCM18916_3347 [Cutibacterium acnes JCM 18916]|nr:hypothetical protein JCM18916_3347 [Cutibacterium acnes JCM 18916]